MCHIISANPYRHVCVYLFLVYIYGMSYHVLMKPSAVCLVCSGAGKPVWSYILWSRCQQIMAEAEPHAEGVSASGEEICRGAVHQVGAAEADHCAPAPGWRRISVSNSIPDVKLN